MHRDLQFGGLLSWTRINWPISFCHKKLQEVHSYTKTKEPVFCDCLWRCQTWLWLGLASGRNRCLRAQASLRAQRHCVQSRSGASEVEHLCVCLNGIIWGAQKWSPPPQIPCLLLQCIWPLHRRHCFHRAGIEMPRCAITAAFCHYHINIDELARWTAVRWGWREKSF